MPFKKIQIKYSVFLLACLVFYLSPARAAARISTPYPQSPIDEQNASMGSVLGSNGIIFGSSGKSAKLVKGGKKNKKAKDIYKLLWQSAIEHLSYRNITSANYEGGDIITDWYQEGQKETKIVVLIEGDVISVDSIVVKAFSRIKTKNLMQDRSSDCKEDKELASKFAEAIIEKIHDHD